VINVHTSTKDKNYTKDSSYEELVCVFNKFLKYYHMKILLGYFNVKVGKEDIFKPTTGNEILHEHG